MCEITILTVLIPLSCEFDIYDSPAGFDWVFPSVLDIFFCFSACLVIECQALWILSSWVLNIFIIQQILLKFIMGCLVPLETIWFF